MENVDATQSWLLEEILISLLTTGRSVRRDIHGQAANCVSHSSPILAPIHSYSQLNSLPYKEPETCFHVITRPTFILLLEAPPPITSHVSHLLQLQPTQLHLLTDA